MLYYASWLAKPWIPVAIGVDDPKRDRQLASASRIEEWHGIELRADADELVDYLPNNVGVRLCSPRMRSTLDMSIGPSDELQWLPASVLDRANRTNPYFVLHLPGAQDILDDAESVFVGDFVVKPVFSWAKVGSRNVVRVPESTVTLIVTERMRQALLASGYLCTLIRTLNAAGSHQSWPEPTVTTVLSRTPPEACRDSGMRYQFSLLTPI